MRSALLGFSTAWFGAFLSGCPLPCTAGEEPDLTLGAGRGDDFAAFVVGEEVQLRPSLKSSHEITLVMQTRFVDADDDVTAASTVAVRTEGGEQVSIFSVNFPLRCADDGQGSLSPDLTVPIDTTLSQEDLDGLLVVVSAEIWTAESGIVAGEQLLTLSVLGR